MEIVSRKDAKAQRREGVGGLLFESLRLGVLSEAGVRFKVFPPGMGKAAASALSLWVLRASSFLGLRGDEVV